MQIQCPACRKINRVSAECSRCACDLSPLAHIIRVFYLEASRARNRLHAGDPETALEHASCAWSLLHEPAAAQLAFFCCLLLERYEEASFWYAAAGKESGK